MAGTGYEIFALFMRYVFVGLGALILLRGLLWLLKDAGAWQKEIKNLPDAGLVGELRDVATDKSYPLPREGVLGRKRSCDVRIKGHLMQGKALTFLFVDGKGLAITPLGGQNVYLDGEAVRGSKGYALHGTQLEVGGIVLKVRLFAGLNVPRRVLYRPGEEEMETTFDGPSPFEEVAGMFTPEQPEWMETPGQAQPDETNPFMDEMALRQYMAQAPYAPAYPSDGNGYAAQEQYMQPDNAPEMRGMYQPMNGYIPQNDGTEGSFEPQMGYVPDAVQQPELQNDAMAAQEMPVRRRRSERYL